MPPWRQPLATAAAGSEPNDHGIDTLACARSAIQKAYMMPAESRNRKAVRYLVGSQIGSRVGVARAQDKDTRVKGGVA